MNSALTVPIDEKARLRALRGLDLLDSPPEDSFDELCRLASEICDVPIALITLVGDEHIWVKSAVGVELQNREGLRRDSLCTQVILDNDTFLIPDATQDDRTSSNPYVTGDFHLRFYAGAPLRAKGHAMGALCVMDRVPREMTPFQLRALRVLANQVERELSLRAAATELRRAEGNLRRHNDVLSRSHEVHEQFLHRVLANSPASIFTLGLDGRYLSVNGGTLTAFGFSPAELIGRSALKLYRDVPEAVDAISRALKGETVARLIRMGGFVYDARLAPLHDADGKRIGVTGFAMDVTARERAQERLELLRHAREVLADSASFRDAAPEVLSTLCRAGEWTGATVWELQDGVPVRQMLVQAEPPSGINFVPHMVEVWADGEPRWVSGDKGAALLFSIRAGQEIFAVVKLHTNVRLPEDAGELTSMSRLGQQMGEHLVHRRAQEELRISTELRKLRDEMSAMIVHDLKNPMAAVIGNLDFALSMDSLLDEARESVEDAQSAARRTLRLVLGLLTEVSLERGKLDLRRATLELPSFLRGIVGVRRRFLERYGIELVTDLNANVPVSADPELLTRVVENLLDNAHRHTPKGGRLLVAAESTPTGARITVANTGNAVPSEMREHIFGKFGQASSHRQGRGNLGLGLYFCRTAIDAHEGSIHVESDDTWPVKFVVDLPGVI